MQFVRGGPDVPERVLQAHEEGRVVFFCGAGISYPAGLPGFAGLVDELYSRLGIIPNPVQTAAIKSKRYDTAVGLLEANFVGGRQAVRRKIAEILDPDISASNATATHEALLTLAECRERRTRLITTNFDRLFEYVIANGRPSAERFEAPLLPVPKQRWDGLVYLHGLLPENAADKSLDNLVVSSGDFGLAYLTERWAARFVSELLRNFVVCFIGYSIPYPLFRRLAFFAAAQDGIVPRSQGLGWLLADDNWWLWSVETQRETMRLLVAFGPQLDEDELARLERAILAGPPREMYRPDIEEERWIRIQESKVWLRLAKISRNGAELGAAARSRLDEISAKFPNWELTANERDEFPTWTGDAGELRVHVAAPRDRDGLIQWLRDNPEPDDWRPDDWRERCRDDFDEAAAALAALAAEGIWPSGRWREALQRWSEDELRERSWRVIALVLANVPGEKLQELSHGVSWWLEKQARTFEGHEAVFLALCDRLLAVDYEVEEEGDSLLGRAINHPVGQVTEALLHWWYRSDLEDQRGLADEPRRVFTQLCDTGVPKFRHGRLLLATHVISLFRVDREWATRFLLPLFEWENAEVEARSAWEGFLWSPRLYPPLMELLKPAFLDTANHYAQLGQHREQYASLLTFAGLDPGDIFGKRELALAMRAFPQDALDHAADTFSRAVDSAGDRRADYWRNRAAPYLVSIWPNTPDAISESVSESFAEACIAAGDGFSEAMAQVSSWLRPLQYPDQIAHSLHETQLDTRFPESALELLNRIVGDAARGYFADLATCLSAVQAAQPDLEQDHRFQRLLEIVRANGEDLD